MTADPPSQIWDGRSMSPAHDHLYKRPPSAYGAPEHVDGRRQDCAAEEVPLSSCVDVMQRSAHASARTLLQVLFAVDIDDPESLEAFQNRRPREAELHQLIEKAMTGTLWSVAKITAAIVVAIAALHVKDITTWFGKP